MSPVRPIYFSKCRWVTGVIFQRQRSIQCFFWLTRWHWNDWSLLSVWTPLSRLVIPLITQWLEEVTAKTQFNFLFEPCAQFYNRFFFSFCVHCIRVHWWRCHVRRYVIFPSFSTLNESCNHFSLLGYYFHRYYQVVEALCFVCCQ
jgi:hypothetical protein